MKKLGVMLPLFLVVIALTIPFDAKAAQRPGEETFRTSALAAPTLRSPGSGTLLQNMGAITLSFELPSGSTQYHFQVTPFRGDGPGVNLIRNAETSFTLQPPTLGIGPYVMLPGMTYTWRIRATDATTRISDTSPLWGDWTDEWSFTTPPPSSASIRPQDPPLGVKVTSLTPTLTWSDDNPYIFYYEIEVSKDILFDTNPFAANATTVYQNRIHGGESRPFNSWAVPVSYPLEQGCRYYWRVRPRVQGNGTPVNWGQSFWFDAPARPGSQPCVAATGTPSVTPTPTATATPTATPTPSSYTLIVTKVGNGTVSSFPPGITCGVDCSERFDASKSTVVTLTAIPDEQWTFNSWAGDDDCSDGVVTMNGNRNCTAIFSGPGSGTGGPTYTLFVSKTGTGSGTVTSSPPGINCGDDCSEVYRNGTSVQLTGAANSGSAFVGFSGDSDCTDTVVTMNASKTCVATFTALSTPTPAATATRTPTPAATNTPTPTPAPIPTPTGRIAFQSDRDGNAEIYVMNADGSGQTRLTNNPANDDVPAWSPDGAKIAFQSTRDGNYDIYVMNADGSGQTRLTTNPYFNDDVPAWSPRGGKIAFKSTRDGNAEIYVMNADGTGQTRLTTNSATDGNPVWSPNGAKIAFESNRDGNYEIYVMNADGSGQTRLTNNPATDARPGWSPK